MLRLAVLTMMLIGGLLVAACGISSNDSRTATAAATKVRALPTPSLVPPQTPVPTAASTPDAVPIQSATAAETGIEGNVLLGPTCPVQRVDSPCPDRPYVATIDVVDATSGATAATVTSGDDGRFRVLVPAGTYRLVPRNTGTLPHGTEVSVTVVEGLLSEAQVNYDSGIR